MHDLLTSTEVAKLLGKSRGHVNRLAAAGKLPGRKLPGRTGTYVFDAEKIADLLRGADAA